MTFAHRTAVIYGDTLLLQGIAEILRARADLEVTEARLALPANLEPDLLLVDAAHTSLAETEALLTNSSPTHPLHVLRLDAAGQSLTVHSIHSLPAVQFSDLAQALDQIFNDSNGASHAI